MTTPMPMPMPHNAQDTLTPLPEQERTRRHYAAIASTYGAEYGDAPDAYGTIYPANRIRWEYVRHRLRALRPAAVLEAGCGEGTPLDRVRGEGHQVYGFDLVPEMVAAATEKVGVGRVWQRDIADPEGWLPAGKMVALALDGGAPLPLQYDAIVALGPLPHLTDAQQHQALVNARRCLTTGGRLFVELRNDLFSLWTLNRYTEHLFTRLLPADAPPQIRESVASHLSLSQPPTAALASTLTRYEHTYSRFNNPLEVPELFAAAGLSVRRVTYYHFHACPPQYQTLAPSWYQAASLALEWPSPTAHSWRGLLQASAFVVEATV